MKLYKLLRTALGACTLTALFAFCVCAEAITFSLGVYDYSAVNAGLTGATENGILLPETIFETESGTSAVDAVRAALTKAGLRYETDASGAYIASIGALEENEGYSGWLFNYNNDDFGGSGLASVTLSDGDVLEFHYAYNPDTVTDDVGNGWYGLPILSSLTVGRATLCFERTTTFDETYTAVTAYTCDGAPLAGKGTEDEPFLITVPVSADTDITALSVDYETTLLAPYRVMSTDLTEPHDYTAPLDVSLSTRGGRTAYYRLTVEPDLCADIRLSKTPLTRAAFAGVLARFLEEDSNPAAFYDVTEKTPHADAIRRLAVEKITRGCSNTLFCPEKSVTLEEALVMLYRYACPDATTAAVTVLFPDETTEGLSERILFTDDFGLSEWAKDGVAWCAANGVITVDEAFDAKSTVTGAALAAMLDRIG